MDLELLYLLGSILASVKQIFLKKNPVNIRIDSFGYGIRPFTEVEKKEWDKHLVFKRPPVLPFFDIDFTLTNNSNEDVVISRISLSSKNPKIFILLYENVILKPKTPMRFNLNNIYNFYQIQRMLREWGKKYSELKTKEKRDFIQSNMPRKLILKITDTKGKKIAKKLTFQ